jgi:SAM-dependent methyltransferase
LKAKAERGESHPQVEAGHYGEGYDALYRWISYWYQLREVRRLRPASLLEIGVGNGTVSRRLAEDGIAVTTCDFDAQLAPDVCGDVRRLPFGPQNFDVVLCAQVLEHLPFDEFPALLGEIARVSRRYAVITLPCSRAGVYVVPTFLGAATAPRLALRLPLPNWLGKLFFKQHEWEIGRLRFPLRKVRRAIRAAGWRLRREVQPVLNTYHYFFVLEKHATDLTD